MPSVLVAAPTRRQRRGAPGCHAAPGSSAADAKTRVGAFSGPGTCYAGRSLPRIASTHRDFGCIATPPPRPPGLFLQVDPIFGGSLSAYDYANQDPGNEFDLAGLATAGGRCIEGRKGFNRKACEAGGFKITLKGAKYASTTRLEKLCMMATGASLPGLFKTLLAKVGTEVVVTRLSKAGAAGSIVGAIKCDF